MDRDRLRHRQTDKAPYSGGSRDSRFSVGPSLECRSSRFVGKAAKVRVQRQGAFPKSALIRGRQVCYAPMNRHSAPNVGNAVDLGPRAKGS
jgi:hypothetical protein